MHKKTGVAAIGALLLAAAASRMELEEGMVPDWLGNTGTQTTPNSFGDEWTSPRDPADAKRGEEENAAIDALLGPRFADHPDVWREAKDEYEAIGEWSEDLSVEEYAMRVTKLEALVIRMGMVIDEMTALLTKIQKDTTIDRNTLAYRTRFPMTFTASCHGLSNLRRKYERNLASYQSQLQLLQAQGQSRAMANNGGAIESKGSSGVPSMR